ncbi:MAG: galactokinase [Alphaproteobacteria bacterium]|nr:galactokinase [Alphaproteobacteria bacterium]
MSGFSAKAPARANIIGEHTDYAPNGGHVLPTPLPFWTSVHVEKGSGRPGEMTVSSKTFAGETCRRSIKDAPRRHWTDYVVGCVKVASGKADLPALDISIESDVPLGCGISSSAALCVGATRALRGFAKAPWDDEAVALMAFEAEHDYVGVPCGKMDQFASSIGRPGQALLLDTRTLVHRSVALPNDVALMLVDCGKKHDLAKGDSHTKRIDRMNECIEARDKLGVGTLCELGYADLPRLSALREVVAKRARHVITENQRVLEFVKALESDDRGKQADLLAASHASQRDDFECSIPEIDALVESSVRFGARGARLCGGGFGGAIIALVPRSDAVAWWSFVSKENPNSRLISTYALKADNSEFAA